MSITSGKKRVAEVSVIIPSYNSGETILGCLESLYSQTVLPKEIIIVDSSEDDTVEIIRQHYPEVRVIVYDHRVFPGPARNHGVQEATNPVVAFIDADCLAVPAWVETIEAHHAEGHMIVGGAIEPADMDDAVAWAAHLYEFREFFPVGEARTVLHIPTCNISYQRELFLEHEGFPNAYYPQEDLLFNYLLGMYGYTVWFDPDILVRHYARSNLRDCLSHLHRIGRVTRCTLAQLDLPGSFIGRSAFLSFVMSPVLGVVKFIRAFWAMISVYPRILMRHPAIVIDLMLGIIWWTRGFAAGATTQLSGIRGWGGLEDPIIDKLASKMNEQKGENA